jgi:sugar lactone lactonase YvrE
MFLSVGHDEYWSTGERDALDAARDGGLSIGFFTADTGTYHVRYVSSATGAARRAYLCYKVDGSNRDPERGTPRQTTRFSEPAINRPENALLGVMYAQWTGGARFPMVVRRASHWIYEGTGVVDGDTLASIVGSEYDRLHDNGRTPAGLEVVAESMGLAREGIVDASHATVYYPTRSSLVFAAGTLSWALALGRDDVIDARIQRMTENILARAGLPLDKPMIVPPTRAPQSPGTASSVTLIAGDGVAGYAEGAGPRARFNMPAGVAVGPGGVLYVTDTQNHRVRVVRADGSVATLAGCGPSGVLRSARFRDASGADACFDAPTGIAVAPDGTVYVADTHNHRIRAITPAGVVTTYAGMSEPGMRDDVPARAMFSRPRGLAWGADGALYVADAGNDAIRRVTRTGVTTLARGLDNVLGVALDSEGGVCAITGNATLVVVRGANTTRLTGSPYGFGFVEGAAANARISPGDGIALLGRSVLFADAYTHRVRAYALDTQRVSTFVGDGRWGTTLGNGAQTRLAVPRGMAPYREGVALVDSANHRVLYARP